MESLPLTHPVERWLLGLTALAFLLIVYWKAGQPVLLPSAAPLASAHSL